MLFLLLSMSIVAVASGEEDSGADIDTTDKSSIARKKKALKLLFNRQRKVPIIYNRESKLFKKYPDLRPEVTDCLIGHVFKDFDALWSAAREFATLPDELAYGRPMRASAVDPAAQTA